MKDNHLEVSVDNQMVFNLSINDVYSVDWVHSAKYTKDWVSNTKKVLPPPNFIKQIFFYNSKSGFLYWKHRKDMNKGWNNRFANKKVKPNSANCVGILYNGQRFFVIYHRLVWCCYYEKWPKSNLVIDHKNGDHYNNTIENLRLVTSSENNKNRSIPSNNTSGVIGVTYCSSTEKWQSQITANGKKKNLGRFVNFDDAVKARKSAEIKYGFHENHGRDGIVNG